MFLEGRPVRRPLEQSGALRAVGNDHGCYEVGQQTVAEADAGQQDCRQADQGGVQVKVFSDSAAYAADHAAAS